MQLWLPENFTGLKESTLVLRILIIGLIPDLMTGVSINLLQAVNKHRYYALQTLAEGTINLVLSLILAQKMGLTGIALGTAIPALITKFFFQPLYVCNIIKISYFKYILKVLVYPILLCTTIVFIFKYLPFDLLSKSFVYLVIKGFTILILYAVPAYFFPGFRRWMNISKR